LSVKDPIYNPMNKPETHTMNLQTFPVPVLAEAENTPKGGRPLRESQLSGEARESTRTNRTGDACYLAAGNSTITVCRTCGWSMAEPSNGSPHTCRPCERRATGARYMCSFCGTDLPGSTLASRDVSHGACKPICAAAKAQGWGV